MKISIHLVLISMLSLVSTDAAEKMKMTTEVPASITTPDIVETRLGTLKFTDGLPDPATVEKGYDNLDFLRGVDVFLNTLSAASTLANIEGLRSVGCNNQTVVIHENRVDAKTLLLTPNNLRKPWRIGLRRRRTRKPGDSS